MGGNDNMRIGGWPTGGRKHFLIRAIARISRMI